MQINKQKYTLSQVEEIIYSHLDSEQNLMFICDFSVAHYIYDYIHNYYGIDAECMELSSDVDEYYVSLQFYKDKEIGFFCEFAKMDDGTYKYDEVDNIDYFVMSDMSFGDVREFLAGKGRVIFCEFDNENCLEEEYDCENVDELLDGEEHYQNCSCVSCKQFRGEFTEDEEYEIGLVEHYAGYIENSECECGSDLRNILYSMLQECMSMGYENAREENDEEIEGKNTVNIHIDNLIWDNSKLDKENLDKIAKYTILKIEDNLRKR